VTRVTPPRRADYPELRQLATRWADNDIYGHMNNTVHYQLFDTAVNGYLIEHGILDLRSSETVFLVVESGCSYFAELSFPEVIVAGLRVARLGSSSVRYEIGLFGAGKIDAVAAGHFIHVNVDRNTRRPLALSARTRSVLERLQPSSQHSQVPT
jgi:acyl-CoA thioester hydrolase